MRGSRWLPWGAALAMFAVAVVGAETVARLDADARRSRSVAEARVRATAFARQLQLGAEPTRQLTHALEAYVVGSQGRLRPSQVPGFLQSLTNHGRFVRSVSVAPGNRITYIEPLATNLGAVGLYYPDVPAQWGAIQALIAGAHPALLGPIDLVQGGRGLAFRLAVRVNGEYWGVVSTMLDADPFLDDAARALGDHAGALRPIRADGTPGAVFWGDPAAFSDRAVVVTAEPAGAQWQAAVLPADPGSTSTLLIRSAGYVTSALMAVLVFALLRSVHRRREAAGRLADLSAQVPGALVQVLSRPDGTFQARYVSPRINELVGVSPDEVVHRPETLWSHVSPGDVALLAASMREAARVGRMWRGRIRLALPDGQERWLAAAATPQPQPEGATLWHTFMSDATDQVAAEDQLRVSASVFASTRDGVMILEPEGRITSVNPGFTTLTGFDDESARGLTMEVLTAGLTPPAVHAEMRSSLTRHGFWRGEVVLRTRDGRAAPTALALSVVTNEDGEVSHQVGVLSGLDTLREDFVTGLPSRQSLDDRLAQAVDDAAPDGRVTLVVIGLDGFRDINESHGHQIGDLVLRETGQRLRAVVPGSALVARHGADEFAILVPDSDAATVEGIATDALGTIRRPLRVTETVIHPAASAGISVFPTDASDAAALLTNANQALRVAKEHGRGRYRYFTAAMQTEARGRARLTESLRRAVGEHEFHLLYQPIEEIGTGRLVRAEALIRWDSPDAGFVPPAEFIPVAETSGLITEIGDWVFAEALRMCRQARDHDPHFAISVNMSPVEIAHEGTVHQRRLEALAASGLPGSALILEITEGVLLQAHGGVARTLAAYRAAGVAFAIDDFGTGFSSLSYLQRLDVDYVKIDRSFVERLGQRDDALALCQAIVQMSHALGLLVVAEGVETTTQRDLLRATGCDLAQGFLRGRPMPADDLLRLIAAAGAG